MKRNVLVTGYPDQLNLQGIKCTGFYTEEVRNDNSRIGFDIVTVKGQREILARKSSGYDTGRPKVGQYEVYLNEFEQLALPVLGSSEQIIIIDEIGKMELFSKKFESMVKEIFKNKNVQIIATVPIKGRLNLVEQLKQSENCQLFTVNLDNRNAILSDIMSFLVS